MPTATQGTCQAGNACPFSHSLDTSRMETPCKYFTKVCSSISRSKRPGLTKGQGNCKFGQKCALLHVLPNGRIVNRPPGGAMGALNIGNRVDPPIYQHQESTLGNSLLSQQGSAINQPFGHQLPAMPDASPNLPPTIHAQPFDIPRLHDGFGTPRDDGRQPRSPAMPLTSLAEAKLPASFDSNGISYMAQYGPIAASVPAKLGFESPPQSVPKMGNAPNDALRNLHDSAFPGAGARASNLGSSPSSTLVEPPSTRLMHSQRISKPRMISSSLPRHFLHHDDSDDGFSDGAGEEYVPNVLSHLLSPDERHRRSSGKVEEPIAIRSALTSPDARPVSDVAGLKVGSPSGASPSRFAGFFKQTKAEDQNGSAMHAVGSPFRAGPSHLSPNLRPTQRSSGEFSSPFGVSSPPRHSSTSVLSQQLKRVHLSSNDGANTGSGSSPGLHPPMVSGNSRHVSAPRAPYDRNISTSSVNTNRIIEEDEEGVFSLDDVDDGGSKSPWANQKSPLGSVGDGRYGLAGTPGEAKNAAGDSKTTRP